MNKPFFSVVLPTRNRAGYLPFAIKSALNQTCGDLELIVSNNDSSDGTEEVVREFTDERIRYIKPDSFLSMDEHWDFALGHARGEFITFLGDDDAHSVIFLESIKKIIDNDAGARLISCKMADYYYGHSESLVTSPFTNEYVVYDSAQKLKDLFIDRGLVRGTISGKVEVPQLINGVYHRSLFEQIRENSARVFPKLLASDYYIAAATLCFTEKYHYLDAPLSFHGISPQSATSHVHRESKGRSLKETQPDLAVFYKAPLEIFTPYNLTVDAVLLARAELADHLSHLEIDMTGYYIEMSRQLHALELKGLDITEETKEYLAAVAKLEPEMRREVEEAVMNTRTRITNKLRRAAYRAHLHTPVAKVRGLLQKSQNLVIEGTKNGFSNIIECAATVDSGFLAKYAHRG